MPQLPRVIVVCTILLIISAVLLNVFVPVSGALDMHLIQPWFDASGRFVLRDNWYLDTLNHEIVKKIIIAASVGFLGLWLASFKWARFQEQRLNYGYLFWVSLLSSSIVGLWKSQSDHACPWNMLHQHGTHLVWDLHPIAGHCFPGGHASAGFALITGYFAFRLTQPKRAYFYLAAGLILGFGMGWAQMMRGAHFFSHNVWTLWVVLAVNTLLYGIFYTRFKAQAIHLQARHAAGAANVPTLLNRLIR